MASKSKVFLNLFFVERTDNGGGFGEYENFVICCSDENIARSTHPDGEYEWYKPETYKAKKLSDPCGIRWVKPDKIDELKVTFLGQASPDIKPGVITAFNHGD